MSLMLMYQDTRYDATGLENNVVSWFVFHYLQVYMSTQGYDT
jgi:hypothetical protein